MQAEQMRQQGEYAKALTQYTQVLGAVPEQDHRAVAALEFRMGDCLWALGRGDEAFDALQKSVALDPENLNARVKLAEVLLAGGASVEALEQTRTVLAHPEAGKAERVEALTLQGAAYQNMGNSSAAVEALQQALRLEPARSDAALALAEIELQSGQDAEARKVLQHTAAAAPHDSSPLLALGRLDEISGDMAGAEQEYRSAVQAENDLENNLRLAQFLARTSKIAEAEKVLASAQRLEPAAATALPDFQLNAGRVGSALIGYGRALNPKTLAQNPNPAGELRGLSARIIEAELEQAQEEASAGNDASASLHQAAQELEEQDKILDPATRSALKAELALVQGDHTAALNAAERAVTLAPHSAASYYTLGLAQQEQGSWPAASQNFEKALELDPEFTPALEAVAEMLYRSGNLAAADETLSKLILKEPANFRGLCLYARVLSAQGRIPEALQVARRAEAANPSLPEPHIILGDLAAGHRQSGAALVEYEEAVMLAPHSQAAIERLTELYSKSHISRQLLADIRKVAGSPPASAPLMEIAGRLYAQQGLKAQAKECLREALKIDPQRKTAAAELAKLELTSGNDDQALALVQELDPGARNLVVGMRAAQKQNFPAAIQNYEAVLREGPNAVAANNLAWIYASTGAHLDRALALANNAAARAPQDPDVMDTLGMVHLKRHEFSQAVKAFSEAVTLATQANKEPAEIALLRSHLREAHMDAGEAQ